MAAVRLAPLAGAASNVGHVAAAQRPPVTVEARSTWSRARALRQYVLRDHARAGTRKKKEKAIMPIGTVKFFSNEKGYGFVSRPDGDDVFVHYSNIEGNGFRTLEAGQQVEFEIAQGRKGDEARNVKVI